ncbi:MAG: hypothetical protein WBP38_00830 [Hyphomicrobium sp.]
MVVPFLKFSWIAGEFIFNLTPRIIWAEFGKYAGVVVCARGVSGGNQMNGPDQNVSEMRCDDAARTILRPADFTGWHLLVHVSPRALRRIESVPA